MSSPGTFRLAGAWLLFGAACFALRLAVGFVVGTTEIRQIRRELDALRRRLGNGEA